MIFQQFGLAKGSARYTILLVTTLVILAGLIHPGVTRSKTGKPSFETWLNEYRQTLRREGFSTSVLQRALGGLSPLEKVLVEDEDQPEFTVDFERYSGWFLTEKMVRKGRCLGSRYADELRRVTEQFGVPPRYILSIWGMESRYGTHGARYPVIRSLATLVYGSDRSDYFDRQLRILLRIIETQPVEPDQLRGSWAGALGQPQFMPASYRDYAVDFDDDGFADIWKSRVDVFASIANYLQRHGWEPGQGWGRPLPPDAEVSEKDRVIEPGGSGGRRFLVTDNFDALMAYNPSHHYALTVGLLADRIGSSRAPSDSSPESDEPQLDCSSPGDP